MPDKDKDKPDSIQLRGSSDDDIQKILSIVEKIEGKPEDKGEITLTPVKPVSEVFQEKTTAELERDKALEENKKLKEQQRESLLDSFRDDEKEYYKDHSIKDLQLILNDRKQRKENLFLTDPEDPQPTKKTTPTINRSGDSIEIIFDQADTAVGYGQTVHGVGYYDKDGKIVSKDKGNPYGVKK